MLLNLWLTVYLPAAWVTFIVVKDALRRHDVPGANWWIGSMIVLFLTLPVAAIIESVIYMHKYMQPPAFDVNAKPVTPSMGGEPRYCLDCNFSSIEAEEVSCRACGSSNTAPVSGRSPQLAQG